MNKILEWILENPEPAAAIAVFAADFIAGAIPDKKVAYKGVARRLLKALSDALEK